MGKRRNSLKRRRENLLKKDPHCYWCKVEVVYYELKHGEKTPDNFATIDHLFSRLDPNRAVITPRTMRLVLSCYKCNYERGRAEIMALPVEERRRMSGSPEDNWKRYQERKMSNEINAKSLETS